MPVAATIVLVAWVAFWLYWLAAAARAKPGRERWGRFAGVRIVLVLLLLLLARANAFRGEKATSNPWLEGIGLVVFFSGLALAVWARVYLGRNWGTPMSEKDDPELVTSGPYRRVRHPIYSGVILAMVGTAIAVSWYWVIAVAVLAAYFVYSAVMEERYMTERFPDTYPGYKRATKMLVPFLF